MTAAVYTAIYGGHDTLPTLPDGLGLDAVCYTDDPYLAAPGWDVRVAPLPNLAGPRMAARFWKLHPRRALPGHDRSLWLDANMAPTGRVGEVFAALAGDVEMVLLPHPERDCIYDEAGAAIAIRPEVCAGQPVAAQVDAYRAAGFPAHAGLYATGMIARAHTAAVATACRAWWDELCRWSVRDQLSLPPVLASLPALRWATWDQSFWSCPWFDYRAHLRVG